jgi:predicted tellurium resistance membrane protein TerC
MMIWLLDRFPWLMILGGALLGWIAGGLAVHDPVSAPWLSANMPWLVSAAPFLGAGLVVAVSVWLMRRPRPTKRAEVLDMGDPGAGRER